jgi:hypothetical protein
MTVKEFYNTYRNLTINLVNGQSVFHVDVHEYRNAHDYFSGGNEIAADHDVTDGMNAWAILRQNIRRNGKSLGTNRWKVTFTLVGPPAQSTTAAAAVATMPALAFQTEIVNVEELAPAFYGKGSPAAIREALRLVAAFGLAQPTSAALNAYCTADIGLDCSGFVGNYMKQEGLGSFSAETGARQFAPESNRISKLDDIDAQSVIVWKNTNHVALVDQVEPFCRQDGTVHAWVAESCGSQLVPGDVHTDGLNYTEYVFHSVDKHKVFQVVRGIGGHSKNSVYVANY